MGETWRTLRKHNKRWDFIFPTEAERIAWRVLTLMAVCLGCIPLIVAKGPLIALWLGTKNMLPSCVKGLGDPSHPRTTFEVFLGNGALYLYYVFSRTLWDSCPYAFFTESPSCWFLHHSGLAVEHPAFIAVFVS